MPLKDSKIVQKEQIQPGTVLIESKQTVKLLLILHEGLVSAVNGKLGGQKPSFLYELPKNSIIGFASLLSHSPSPVSYMSQTPALISAFPVSGSFQKLIMGKLNLGFMAAHSLLYEVYGSYQAFSKSSNLAQHVAKLQDNTALAYKYCLPEIFRNGKNTSKGGYTEALLQAAQLISKDFEQKGGQYPNTLTQSWLETDHSNLLGKNYRLSSTFDTNAFQLYRKILALPMNVQSNIYKTDLSILERLSQQLKQMLYQNINELYSVQESMGANLESLFSGDKSYTEKLNKLKSEKNSNSSKASIDALINFFYKSSQLILRHYQVLLKLPYHKGSQELAKLGQSITGSKESSSLHNKTFTGTEKTSSYAGVDGSSIHKRLAGSPVKIMSILKIGAEEGKKVLDVLKKLKSLPNPLDTDQSIRKLRREFSMLYWNIWGKAYKNYQENQDKTAQEIQMMIHFAFFDEELLDESHLSFICTQNTQSRKENSLRYPILNIREWLEKIHTKEDSPSVNELGQSYFEKLKQENKNAKWKREADVPAEIDTPQKRLDCEIQTFLENNVRLCSGTPMTCLPILNRYQLLWPIEKAFLSKDTIQAKVSSLLAIDYSAFHREVIFSDEELGIIKEFIQKQICPYFITIPSTGTKAMMWQEITGRNKSSPGRIVLPIFATTDLYTMLAKAVGAFRWEMTKTVMGADWNNLAQPSLTADYTDYVQFYKKNRDLSAEMKEKLNREFKRFRSNRDRFVNDYLSWLQYESQGVMKLNKVLRGIFYRHMPFHRRVRKQIGQQPAFTEFHNRFCNIRARKTRELENRYRKFGDNLAPVLKANLDFYSV